jgi:integrative and conjugative element protein (TIGR02256 family)
VSRSWISLHPDWYVAERASIARRWPGFRVSEPELRAGKLAYAGVIQIDIGKEKREFPVVMVYPADTPYSLPVVVPVTEVPAGHEWTLQEALAPVRRSWMPTAHRRHQMGEGQLCLVERDSHAGEDLVHGEEILRRTKDVFKAVALGEPFPYPDSEEAALESHFEEGGDFLLSEAFYDESLHGQGRFYAFPQMDAGGLWPGYIPQSEPPRLLFVGINIAQTTPAGIGVEWRNAESEALSRVFPWLSFRAFSYEEMRQDSRLSDLVQEGFWYDLDFEPPPHRTGEELQDVLAQAGVADPGAELERWWDVLRAAGGHQFSALIGFRFPRRDGAGREWLVLQLDVETDVETDAALKREPGMRREVLRGARVSAFRTHPLVRPQLELRNTGQVPQELREKSILVIGCGALGGDVALTLAKAGTGRLVLVDLDFIRPGNVVRHVSPLVTVGMKKVDAVRHQIWQHNPFVNVEVKHQSATRDLADLEELLRDCDLAVSTVADENTEMVINEAAVRMGRTVIYGRALRAGSAARIFRVRPECDACKRCLSFYRRDREAGEDCGAHTDVPHWVPLPDAADEVIGRECGNPILAGSAADLRIAADFTRAILDELGAGTAWNTLIWSREALPATDAAFREPYGVLRQSFPPHPDCTVCGRPLTTEILLAAEVRAQIIRLTEAKAEVETGGVLIGHRAPDGRVHVVEATDAGPNAVETATRFERDRDYCQAQVEDAARRLGEQGQYIGEWHSHLERDPRPSPRDIESLTGIAAAPNYLTDEPVMLITGRDPASDSVLNIHASCFPIARRWYERPLRVEDA